MGAIEELTTAAQCIEGARQALARAAEIFDASDDIDWLKFVAEPDRELQATQFTVRHLLLRRRTVER